MSNFVFDIETGPLPWDAIKSLYVPPAALPPWNDAMVKYGLTKDPAKRKEKYDQVKADYLAKLASETKAIDDDRAQWASEAALSPVTGQILAVGIMRDDEAMVLVGDSGETEAEIVESFWTLFRKHSAKGRFVGYCSSFFDFPYIVWRSYFHGIEVPASAWDKTGRYPAYCFTDLMDRLPKRGFSEQSRKLTDVCTWLGLGSKPEGIDGGDFARLWAGDAESKAAALAYLENDLRLTLALAKRMGVL